MSRWIVVAVIGLSMLISGCGSDKDKDRYRESDPGRPRASDKAEPAAPKK